MRRLIIAMMMIGLSWQPAAFAADSSGSATITLSGVFSPFLSSALVQVNACSAGTTFAACKATLDGDATLSSGHATTQAVAISNFGGDTERKRYIKFEVRIQGIMFASDYMQFNAGISGVTNNITSQIMRLTFVSAGGSFGQTTLGDTGGNFLSANDAVIDDGEEVTLSALTAVWDQNTDAAVDQNAKVLNMFDVGAFGNPLIMRGILEIDFSEDATSSAFAATITVGATFKDD